LLYGLDIELSNSLGALELCDSIIPIAIYVHGTFQRLPYVWWLS